MYNEKNIGKQCYQHFILYAPVGPNVPKKGRNNSKILIQPDIWHNVLKAWTKDKLNKYKVSWFCNIVFIWLTAVKPLEYQV